MPLFSFREGTPDDAEDISARVAEAFADYRSFAPEWTPPEPETDHIRLRLLDSRVWCLIADADGVPAGHLAFLPSELSVHPGAERDMAHLWQLFVIPRFWGAGLATELHGRAVGEAARRRFRLMRLFTPVAQARARRFYEREDWVAVGPAIEGTGFGLPVLEYRRALG